MHPSRPQTASDPPPTLLDLLDRPAEQRRREYQYRFAQSVVFGSPVLVLQWFGPQLGGNPGEWQRWVGLLQAILTGWVTYVAAVAMLVEGLILRRLTLDAVVGAIAVFATVYSAISVLGIFFQARPFYGPLLFHVAVLMLIVYCGIRWQCASGSRNGTVL
jgi:hypothetical protein